MAETAVQMAAAGPPEVGKGPAPADADVDRWGAHEREAEEAADQVVGGGLAGPLGRAPAVVAQHKPKRAEKRALSNPRYADLPSLIAGYLEDYVRTFPELFQRHLCGTR